ncbi:uncharacterized protein [Mytilus edulis]|uniref:uncharacterized protein n=1 Tax=Mytilus edulis TaxID=6550 RepID=UPI0039F12368
MYNQNCLHFSFLLILVVGYTVDSTSTMPTPPFMTYRCNAGKVTDITISNDHSAHVRVLTKDGGYCQPVLKTMAGVLQCITSFYENADAKTDKIKAVTILYEEMTIKGIVGGEHFKYYTLSCLGKVGVVQAEMIQMTVGKPGQNEEKTTLKGALHLTISTVNSKLVDHTMAAKIGEKLSLSITSPGIYMYSTTL